MLPASTAEHYRAQQRLAVATVAAGRRAWTRLRPFADPSSDLDTGWQQVAPSLVTLTSAAQIAAARSGAAYVPQTLDELGERSDPVAATNPAALAGVAPDGRSLDGLLYSAVTTTKLSIGRGLSIGAAHAAGGSWLEAILETILADTARSAAGVAIAAERGTTFGWVRMVNPPCCSRCAILAGRWYGWNAGFLRHPRCDCRHIPAPEHAAHDLTTDPTVYFGSLSPAEQDRTFTKAGAQAIRDGADVGQVVNARRGMSTAGATQTTTNTAGQVVNVRHQVARTRNVGGQQVLTTTAGRTLRRGPRLMPEAIYRQAGDDKAEAQRLLRLHGYLR